jgi:BioD-like phosphotransacetylase family protein
VRPISRRAFIENCCGIQNKLGIAEKKERIVSNTAQPLLIGSIEPFSGKSGTIVGLAHQLREKGITVSYGKPIGTCPNLGEAGIVDEDVQFLLELLELSADRVRSPLLYLDGSSVRKRLEGKDDRDYERELVPYLQGIGGDIVLIEGAGTLWEGSIFHLAMARMARILAAPVLLVARYTSSLLIDGLLKAKEELGDALIGVVISDVPDENLEEVRSIALPYLQSQGIEVLGLLPANKLLRSVSVREIVHLLDARVLCRPDRLDWMVESLAIGAMNVNAALEYFRKGENMAVITGGDRTDLQLAALETSTSCLILTGHISPEPMILERALDLEVPILSVNLDTLTTVEIVDLAFGKVRLQEQVKVDCIRQLMGEYFQVDRLLEKLGIS